MLVYKNFWMIISCINRLFFVNFNQKIVIIIFFFFSSFKFIFMFSLFLDSVIFPSVFVVVLGTMKSFKRLLILFSSVLIELLFSIFSKQVRYLFLFFEFAFAFFELIIYELKFKLIFPGSVINLTSFEHL